jgi:hypothetical protein
MAERITEHVYTSERTARECYRINLLQKSEFPDLYGGRGSSGAEANHIMPFSVFWLSVTVALVLRSSMLNQGRHHPRSFSRSLCCCCTLMSNNSHYRSSDYATHVDLFYFLTLQDEFNGLETSLACCSNG